MMEERQTNEVEKWPGCWGRWWALGMKGADASFARRAGGGRNEDKSKGSVGRTGRGWGRMGQEPRRGESESEAQGQ